MLKEFLQFLNGLMLEKEMIITPTLFKILSNMKHDIANILLRIHREKSDIGDNSFFDIHPDKVGDVTMLSAKRLDRIPEDEIYTSKSRVPTGMGKLVRAILLKNGFTDIKNVLTGKDMYDSVIEFTGRDIELFVNEFKAEHTKEIESPEKQEFKLVEGDDIKYWYHEDNHNKNTGSLGSSCMRYEKCQEYLDIYVDENLKLLVYINIDEYGVETLLGRALIWENMEILNHETIDKVGKHITFMDRIYTTDDYIFDIFKKYATKQGWWFKLKQSFSDRTSIQRGDDIAHDVHMKYALEGDYDEVKTPYIDTLAYYFNRSETFLSNIWDSYAKELTSTNGNWCDVCGGEGDEECYECDGRGTQDCDDCEGSGKVSCEYCEDGKYLCGECDGEGTQDCDDCDGEGYNNVDGENIECEKCSGSGKEECTYCEEGMNECPECSGRGEEDCGNDECYYGSVNCEYCNDGRRECYECN